MFSKKATKNCQIFTTDLTLTKAVTAVKKDMENGAHRIFFCLSYFETDLSKRHIDTEDFAILCGLLTKHKL